MAEPELSRASKLQDQQRTQRAPTPPFRGGSEHGSIRRNLLSNGRLARRDDQLAAGKRLVPHPEVDNLSAELDETFGPGIYIAVGTSPGSSEHQCGFDSETRSSICADSWEPRSEDAFGDALDGSLSGSPVAVCQANAALAVPMEFDAENRAAAAVLLAFSDTARGVLALLDETRKIPAARHEQQTDQWWREWIAPAVLPEADDAQLKTFSKRALITLKIYTDRTTGATVDSIQPPWQVWPLDAADHALALDLAGYRDMAETQNAFLATVQRKEAGETIFGPFPAGSLAEAHYADGTLAAPIPFIISWTSRVVWSWWTHAKFIDDARLRKRYLQTVYPAIRLEEDESLASRWEKRAEELKDAILASDHPRGGPCDYWWIWPAQVISPGHALLPDLADFLWEELEPGLNREADVRGIFYYGWYMTTLARAWAGDDEKIQKLKEAIRIYTGEIPTPGTHHLGDDFLIIPDGEGGADYLNVTSTPNSFSSTNIYIAAMAVYNPELFDSLDSFSADVEPRDGCGCQAPGSRPAGCVFFLFPLALVLLCTRRSA